MSYCRWSSDGFKSDVYVYADVAGGFTCHVTDGKTFNVSTAMTMANELTVLRNMGYHVPQYAIDALYEEGKGNGEQAQI